MTSDHKSGERSRNKFQFRRARTAAGERCAEAQPGETAPLKAANEKRGFDPYNTSGSFDRKKNWMRVGKR